MHPFSVSLSPASVMSDVVALAVLRIVHRALPLVGAGLFPSLENRQADDRPVPEARVLVGLVRLRLALLVVRLADPHDRAAQSLLWCCAFDDLDASLALVGRPQAEDALVLRRGGADRHEQRERAGGGADGKHMLSSSSVLGSSVAVAGELHRQLRGSFAGPQAAAKIGRQDGFVQALGRSVYCLTPPSHGFLFRRRHWRLPRCFEIDRCLEIISDEKSALVERLAPADAIVFAI